MSGVNAHAIISQPNPNHTSSDNTSTAVPWKRSMRCFVEVLTAGHPLLYTAASAVGGVSNAKHAFAFKVPLSRPCLSFLWDHQVNGAFIMPGAAYLEASIAATTTSALLASPLAAIVGAAILAPCVLPEPDKASSIELSIEVANYIGSISISSSGAVATSHLKASIVSVSDGEVGVITRINHSPSPSPSLEIARALARDPQDTASVYQGMRSAGLQYGPTFRLLRNVKSSKDAAFATLDAAPTASDSIISGFLMNPAVLDNCLQLGAVVPEPQNESAPEPFVPATIAAFIVNHPLEGSSRLAAMARRSPETAQKQSTKATYRDQSIVDMSGTQLMVLEGLEAKPLHGAGRSGAAGRNAGPSKALEAHDVLYEVQWNAADRLAEVLELSSSGKERNEIESTLSLSRITSTQPTAVAGAVLATLQGALHLHAQSVQLNTTQHAPSAARAANSQNFAASEMWGMLRSFAAEAPAVGASGIRFDSADPVHGVSSTAQMKISTVSNTAVSDGYGISAQAGVGLRAALLRCTSTRQAPPHFHLMPRPRGAFRNLVAEPVVLGASSTSSSSSANAGWVEMQVKSVGINFRDVLNVLGMYPGDPGPPGGDCAGIITRIPPDCHLPYAVGDAVFGLAAGSLGSYVIASPHTLVPLPKGLTFEEAASMPTVFTTVDTALVQLANVTPGETVLVHAAAGGVGLSAIQMTKTLNARVVATAGSSDKRNLVRSVGVEAALGSRDTVFVGELAELGGTDIVLNSLTSSGMVAGSLAGLRAGGRFVEISKRDIWSGARVAQERPDVAYSLVAVDFMSEAALNAALTRVAAGAATGALKPLPLVGHDLSNVSSALRQMSQARHVGKIVVRSPALKSANPSQISEGSVLVTGGMGVLGSQVAQWLTQNQVSAVTLLGRSGHLADESTALAVTSSSSLIFKSLVTMAACDISDEEGAIHALSLSSERPLQGVMHAAGVLADGTMALQRFQGLQTVFGPKVDAALALQHHIPSHSISYQVLFSSVAALMGSPGQANYSAANSLLDALAGAAQQAGSVATSVQWGAWAGAGMAAGDTTTAARIERTGMSLLAPSQGLGILEGMFLSTKPSTALPVIAATPFVWGKFLKRFGAKPPVLFSEFVQEIKVEKDGSTADGASGSAGAAWAGISQGDRKVAVETLVKDAVRSILGADVSANEPLMAAGLDSLGAVELKNALEGRMGLQLPGTLIFDYPTIEALTEHLQTQLPESESVDETSSTSVVDLVPATDLGLLSGHHSSTVLTLAGLSTRSATPGAILSTSGVDAITPVPLERWDLEVATRLSLPARFGGFLPAADVFDLALFGLSMTEAELMDAQQRILLEGSYEVCFYLK